MAEELWAWGQAIQAGEVNLCIFPHLREFLVIDVRRGLPGRPLVRVLSAEKVLDEAFYREIEQEFSSMLREMAQPFLNLVTLPQRLEALVRKRSLAAILRKVNEDVPDAKAPSVSILLCSGPVLGLPKKRLTELVARLVGQEQDAQLIGRVVEQMEPLLAQEREQVRQMERQYLRRAIQGQLGDFYTLWENRQ